MADSNLRLFTGNANPELAKKISDKLNMPLGKAMVSTFSDGEIRVQIEENVRGREVFLLQPTCAPTNNTLMEMVIMADALKRASAKTITAVVPYYGYARQDRRVRSARVPITAKVVADMMAGVGIDHMVTVDLHADQIQGFFKFPVDNIYASTPMLEQFVDLSNCENMVVVSPDVGGVVRARAIAKRLNDRDLAIIDKRRPEPNQSEVMHVIGDVAERDCVIVDDMVDTAGTLCAAAAALKKHGAKSVIAYATHAVLSGKAIENLNNSELDKLVVSDSIPLSKEAQACDRINVITLSGLLAETIERISTKRSVSSLFE